ncbi:MAG: nicotinate phosphoribosyltransferase, partial [Pseudomonadota bacterium]
GRFDSVMIDYLSGVRFEGDVDAMPEGTVFFPNEPIIRIAAPLPLAQLIETRIINLLHYQCLVASKAARMVLAAPGKILLDFGLRRAHAGEAGMLAARASYLAGFTGTATVAAEPVFGVPIFGTMAHSFIQAHTDEVRAFEDFAHARPEATVFLIDTYDTESAAEKVVSLAPQLRSAGIEVQGVRIDSGDLVAHARKVRAILNSGGLPSVKIFASGGLDEDDLLRFESEGAPIDGYGIGTSLTTSSDVPALDCAYKLQEFEGVPRRKKSEGKETWPGRKQVFRLADADGGVDRDVVALVDEPAPDGYAPLLQPVMRGGHRVGDPAALDALRDAATRNLAALPVALREMRPAPVPSVGVSDGLRDLARQMDAAER